MTSSSTLFHSLARYHAEALKRMDANLSIHGISYSEYLVLYHLSTGPAVGRPRIELARAVGLSASGVTRLLTPMEKMGLVRKEGHPRDARMSLVVLTEAGRTILDDTTVTVEHVASDMLDSLPKAYQEALSRLVGAN